MRNRFMDIERSLLLDLSVGGLALFRLVWGSVIMDNSCVPRQAVATLSSVCICVTAVACGHTE